MKIETAQKKDKGGSSQNLLWHSDIFKKVYGSLIALVGVFFIKQNSETCCRLDYFLVDTISVPNFALSALCFEICLLLFYSLAK